MSCKSAIYTVNTTGAAYAVNSQVPFGTIVRRFGQNINLNGGGIAIKGQGYYEGDVSVTALVPSAGTVTFTMYKDGVAIPGATGSATVGGAATVNVAFPFIVREQCCDAASVLALVITGADATVTNLATTVKKI